jgi:ribose 5-phosphate isomerase B
VRVHIGANYQGYEFARSLESWLAQSGHEVIWHGADAYDFEDDYPLFAFRIGKGVIADEDAGLETRGILVGGTGTGEIVAANKVNGTRAVPGISVEYMTDAREHGNANILVIGASTTSDAAAKEMITALFETKFKMILDDARRLVNTNEYENSGTIEGWTINA